MSRAKLQTLRALRNCFPQRDLSGLSAPAVKRRKVLRFVVNYDDCAVDVHITLHRLCRDHS